MRTFRPKDEQKPIEENSGFLGMSWDGEFYPGEYLSPLGDFEWLEYGELVQAGPNPRQLTLGTSGRVIEYDAYSDVAFLLDQLSSIEAMRDPGPDNPSPASGSGYVFFLAKGATLQELVSDVAELRAALDGDFSRLLAEG